MHERGRGAVDSTGHARLDDPDECDARASPRFLLGARSDGQARVLGFVGIRAEHDPVLVRVADGPAHIRPADFDPIHWCSIRYATMYLYKII